MAVARASGGALDRVYLDVGYYVGNDTNPRSDYRLWHIATGDSPWTLLGFGTGGWDHGEFGEVGIEPLDGSYRVTVGDHVDIIRPLDSEHYFATLHGVAVTSESGSGAVSETDWFKLHGEHR